MKQKFTILVLLILSFISYTIGRSHLTQNDKIETPFLTNNEAETFVKQMEQLGYFKYADSSDLDSLKQNMLRNFNPESEIPTIWNDSTGMPKDYRYYPCDGENVYEQGGILNLLKNLEPTFKKIDFKCEISNHFEEWDTKKKWLNHRISINGTPYTIFKNFKETGWGEAPSRIAEILNIELKKQGKDEQIYLVSAANDGRLIFLTEPLYKAIYATLTDKQWKPLEINEWRQVMGVKPMKLD